MTMASLRAGCAKPALAVSESCKKYRGACGLAVSPAISALRHSPPPRRPSRPLGTAPRAAAAAAVAAEVYAATGVPLVDALMKLPTVEAAAQHCIRLVAAAAVGVAVGSLVLAGIHRVTGGRLAEHAERFNLPAAALAAVLSPAQALLPFYGLAYAAMVASSLVQVAATKMKQEFATLCCGRGNEVLAVVKSITQLVQDTTELVVIVGVAWAALSFKDRLVSWASAALLTDKSGSKNFVVALLRPLSTLLSCTIFLAAGTTALAAYGVNVGPLMASVGGISLAVGLATQSIAVNVVAALSLYSGGPFVVGDRVQLLKNGGVVADGTVECVEPLSTTIRDGEGNPIYMANAEVAACSIKNLSRQIQKA